MDRQTPRQPDSQHTENVQGHPSLSFIITGRGVSVCVEGEGGGATPQNAAEGWEASTVLIFEVGYRT